MRAQFFVCDGGGGGHVFETATRKTEKLSVVRLLAIVLRIQKVPG